MIRCWPKLLILYLNNNLLKSLEDLSGVIRHALLEVLYMALKTAIQGTHDSSRMILLKGTHKRHPIARLTGRAMGCLL